MSNPVVRYASPSIGCKIRATPGGSELTSISQHDLMYEKPGYGHQVAALGGTNYTWAYVHYYQSVPSPAQGDGWIAIENTVAVSPVVPTKAQTYHSTSYLSGMQMLTNARYIYNYLSNQGWYHNAIIGVLGNMEKESTFNPTLVNSDSGAFGLTQWNPAGKLRVWAGQQGLSYQDIETQIKRILYEVENPLEQWVSTNHSSRMSFSEYTRANASFALLTEVFLCCYEIPGNEALLLPERVQNAQKWDTLISYLL